MSENPPKPPSPTATFLIARVFPSVLILLGSLAIIPGILDIQKGRASINWPTVEGVVTSSNQYTRTASSHESESVTTYHAKIEYDYEVRGRKYTNKSVDAGDYGSEEESHAKAILERYPKDKKIPVYYSPEDPQNSLLQPGFAAGAWIPIAVGSPFVIIGLLMFIFSSRLFTEAKTKSKNS